MLSPFEMAALLFTLVGGFSYLNHRYVGLHSTIGILLLSTGLSLLLILLGKLGFPIQENAEHLFAQIDFNRTLMDGMLSFLLFAGALHVKFSALKEQRWVVGILASVGVITTTILVGSMLYLLLQWVDTPIPFVYCLLFGALIAPTDPIAVLGIVKKLNAPKSLETQIAGESLFNDGVGVVIFLAILGVATGTQEVGGGRVLLLFLHEAGGGAVLGIVLGYLAHLVLRRSSDHMVDVLITLAVVTGGYALAGRLHLSGPIAMVVAGLWVGNVGMGESMDKTIRDQPDTFWKLIDEVLNAVLFLLIGVELLVIEMTGSLVLAGVIIIPMVLLARFASVGLPIRIMARKQEFVPYTIRVLTWGGLRGGISIALALSLPESPVKAPIVAITYMVVVFSILVQGTTVSRLIERAR